MIVDTSTSGAIGLIWKGKTLVVAPVVVSPQEGDVVRDLKTRLKITSNFLLSVSVARVGHV